MKKPENEKTLRNMKTVAITLYEIYMSQSNQDNLEMDCYHANEHDNSGSHPDYHNNSHDNTPGRMMTRVLVKDATK